MTEAIEAGPSRATHPGTSWCTKVVWRRLALWLMPCAAASHVPVSILRAQTTRNTIPASACPAARWGDPHIVAARSQASDLAAQIPNLAVGRTQAFIVGNNIPKFDGRMVPEYPLTMIALGGAYITPPPGDFLFVWPQAVVDWQERVHVLWAEPSGGYHRVDTDHWPHQVSAVWTAHYSRATGWSTPERILEGTNIFWPPGAPFQPREPVADTGSGRGRDGRIALPVATLTGAPEQPLLLLRLHNGRWSVDTVPNGILGGPADAAYGAGESDTQYLGLLAAAQDGRPDRNSVLVQRSIDGGLTWTPPQLVSRSNGRPANWLQVVVGKAGVVHLVWLQQTTGENRILRHTMSHDHGRTWAPVDDYAIAGIRRILRAVADRCGTLHLMYEDWSRGPDRIHLEYATWNGRWSTPVPPFPGWSSHSPSLAVSADGAPLLVFRGKREPSPAGDPDQTYYSKLKP